jgi:hypothetical protein
VVESQPSKLLVAGSIPVSRSILRQTLTAFAASDGKRGPRKTAGFGRQATVTKNWPERLAVALALTVGDRSAGAVGGEQVAAATWAVAVSREIL